MTEVQAPKSTRASAGKTASGRLFVLDLSGRPGPLGESGRLRQQGHRHRVPATRWHRRRSPRPGTSTGPTWACPTSNDGSIERADLDGRNRTTIVPEGGTFTPKQLHLDKKNGKLYWSDREGMRVMRANLDGSNVETLVRHEPGRSATGPRRDEMVRRDHRRSRARAHLLDAKRSGQWRS